MGDRQVSLLRAINVADRRIGVASTGRKWRTVTRLLELSGPQP